MKQYNQVIKWKWYLEKLIYRHNGVNGYMSAGTEREIKEMIDRVDKS